MDNVEIKRIIDQIERLHSGDNWVGLNLPDLLDSIDDEIANLRIPYFNNTIHQIARHLVTDYIVIKRLQGVNYELTDEESWPPSNQISCGFKETVREIKKIKTELIQQVKTLSDNQLSAPIEKDSFNIYINLHGYIQHSFYHFGQMALMKKYIDKFRSST